ncbi:MAG: hypothetical protein JSR46_04975 [Verrucomicrobia bacterium]|nr:hypothetical protein [Verrucomicrobiota bacterium]
MINKERKMLAFRVEDKEHFLRIQQVKEKGLKVTFKHSTPTRGEPVGFAGEGVHHKGLLIYNEKSGHYRPETENVTTCASWMQSCGAAKAATYQKFERKI